MKNLTNIDFKNDRPRTVLEKYNALKNKNPAIEVLKNLLDLEIEF